MWNCDEFGAEASKDGGRFILSKRGVKNVHKIVPDQREWLSILACINAKGETLPIFFYFQREEAKVQLSLQDR